MYVVRFVFTNISLFALFVVLTGCSTLASLGIPVGLSNQLIRPAKEISECPSQAITVPKELAQLPMATYLVEIGDTLFVEPVSFDSTIRMPGDQIVKPDGTISLGEFGNIQVHGKSVEQIQTEVQSVIDARIFEQLVQERNEEQLAEQRLPTEPQIEDDNADDPDSNEAEREKADDEMADINAAKKVAAAERAEIEFQQQVNRETLKNQVNVRIVNWDSKRYYVLGEVNSPGFYQFTGTENVLYGIMQAGGLNSKANRHQIIIARPTSCGSCRVVMKVCYDQIVQLGDASTNYQIMPGDRVFVPSLTFKEDLKETFCPFLNQTCPRCAECPRACNLPEGCEL